MFLASLVLLFILRIRFNKPICDVIYDRYGQPVLKAFRRYEKLIAKRNKIELDIEFLSTCQYYDSIPKFLRIKLLRKQLVNTKNHHRYECYLLEEELKIKRRELRIAVSNEKTVSVALKSLVSWLDFRCMNLFIQRKQIQINKKTAYIHESKLWKLGLSPIKNKLDPALIIKNLSNHTLAKDEERVLMLGLDFGLPLRKINFQKYYLCFEMLFKRLRGQTMSNLEEQDASIDKLRTNLRTIAHKYFYGFKPENNPVFSKKDFSILKNLSNHPNIIITSPDKGRGIVIMNKSDYINKINDILSDKTKFTIIDRDVQALTRSLQDRINNFLRELKKKNIISESDYTRCYASGSDVGYLYGLVKTHKPNAPIRPIVSSYNMHNYHFSKFIIPLISHLATSDYVLNNSYQFVDQISAVENPSQYHMCSFDITSLYTNIPVDETITIILEKIFLSPTQKYHGFSKQEFKKLLELALKDSYFRATGNLYKQIDGLAMGSPLAPVIANIFLCNLENQFLDNCTSQTKPFFYRRYLDDTFILFKTATEAVKFHDYCNQIHPNIKFTTENEENGKLSFLDVTVMKEDGRFNTSVYRKPSFTGKGTNFFSFIFQKYKLCAIKTLLYRAYKISSTAFQFQIEIKFLRNYFLSNNYPNKVFNSVLLKFLSKQLDFKNTYYTASKMSMYLQLPYIGRVSEDLITDLTNLIGLYYPQVKPMFYFTNHRTIKSFFRLKDRPLDVMRSNVIYQYTCSCDQLYIGSTSVNLYVRTAQHQGVSHRTGFDLKNPGKSSIRHHYRNCDFTFSENNFSIIYSTPDAESLRILESILIRKMKP